MAEKMINNEYVMNGSWATRYGPRMVPPGCEPAGPGAVSVWVAGVPAPQGSKRAYGAGRPGGKIRLVESSKRVKPWREDVRQAFLDQRHPESAPHVIATGGEALIVKIVFVMPRPKATSKTRATPPAVKKPDLDKLERAVLDALTSAGVYADDSQVVALYGYKRLAELGEPTGAMIHIERSPVGCEPTCRMLKAGQGGHPGPCAVLESESHMHGRLCGCKIQFGGPGFKII
jgi:crossover junction endodeoxyribonuclease RusA